MTPSLGGWLTKAKEAPCPQEVKKKDPKKNKHQH